MAPELMITNVYISHPLEQRMAARRVAFRHLAVSLALLALALAAGEFTQVDVQALAVGAALATGPLRGTGRTLGRSGAPERDRRGRGR